MSIFIQKKHMTQADMKLRLFRAIDKLNPDRLAALYQALLELIEQHTSSSDKDWPDNITPGEFKEGEKPSDFAGIWEEPRDADQIRIEAWGIES